MKQHRALIALAALAAAACSAPAQTARLGPLPPNAYVVTNELDSAARAALGASNAVLHAALTNETARRIAGDIAESAARAAGTNALHAAVTNEAALRIAGTNALHAAVTNEAALRAAADAAEAALRIAGDARIEALALTNRVTSWPEVENRWWVETPTNRTLYSRSVIGTNLIVVLSGDFLELAGNTRPGWTTNDWPFGTLGDYWVGMESDGNLEFYNGPSKLWQSAGTAYPAVLAPLAGAQGTATVSVESLVYATNVVDSYSLVRDAAPAWIALTNLASQLTCITNAAEAPVSLYATGAVEVAFSGLRPPLPLYLTVSGAQSLTFPAGTRFIGGGSWQTNRINHFIVWKVSTNLFVNPLIATEE